MNAPRPEQRIPQKRRWMFLLLVFTAQISAMLACQGNIENMTIGGIPKYVCPSSTPRPTDTQPPPSPPNYPAAFQVNLDYSYIDTTRTLVNVQILAQNVGTVMLNYQWTYRAGGTFINPTPIIIANTGNFTGVQMSFPLNLPSSSTISSAQVTVWSSISTLPFTISSFLSPLVTTPMLPPCCLPAPIYPTARPTYTPYPTPTTFEILPPLAFYLEDPIYNRTPPVQLRLRMKSPIEEGMLAFIIPLLSAAAWRVEITNVGTVEYDFLGAGYTYVSEVTEGGVITTGVWPPSHQAADFLGITEQSYGPVALLPGQTITVQVAAWIPAGSSVSKVALLLNPYETGDPGWATFTPGSGKDQYIIHWQNALNTVCRGEIAYP